MIRVNVGRGQKRTRNALFHVMFLKKNGASAFRGSEVSHIDATALAAQSHMGITMEGDREATGTRKRRVPQMSSETMSGKDFMSKKPHPGVDSQWTFFEELVLVQLIQLQFFENDIDMAAVQFQFNQLRDTKYAHPKAPQQITRKVVSFLTDNKVFKTIFTKEIRLNWLR